jgi:hypothetical protein
MSGKERLGTFYDTHLNFLGSVDVLGYIITTDLIGTINTDRSFANTCSSPISNPTPG